MWNFLERVTVVLFLLLTFHLVSKPQNYNNSISINGSYNNTPLLLTLETDKLHYQVGDSIQMRFEITNLDSSDVSFTMSCVNLFVVFYIYDENNNYVWDSGAWCLPVVWAFNLPTFFSVADSSVMPASYNSDEGYYTVYGEFYSVANTNPQFVELGFFTTTNPLSIDENPLPQNFKLHQPYPNPFNPTTTIRFNIGVRDAIMRTLRLNIYDITGRLVETLVNGEMQSGEHEIVWNAANQPSGVYFVRLESGEFSQIQKIILIK